MIEKINIITSGKQLDTIVYPHTFVNLDVIFCGRHLENFNDGKLKVKEKSFKKMKLFEQKQDQDTIVYPRHKTKTQ